MKHYGRRTGGPMRRISLLWMFAIGLAMLSAPAAAQPADGAPSAALGSAVRTLEPLASVTIIDRDGTATTGLVERATADEVSVRTSGGSVVTIAASRIARVVKGDSTRNGRIIGLVIGLAGGLAGGLTLNAICENEGANCAWGVVAIAALGAGAGAGIGSAADALHERTIFQRDGAPGRFAREMGAAIGATAFTFRGQQRDPVNSFASFAWSSLPRRGFGVEVEATRTLPNQQLRRVGCVTSGGAAGDTCIDTGEEGVEAATTLGGRLVNTFTVGRIQPYVFGGVEFQRLHRVSAEPHAFPGSTPFVFRRVSTLTSPAILVGGGARFLVGDHVAVRPDVAVSVSGDWRTLRASLGVGYRW